MVKKTSFLIILLILCNILFHFIPFERASLAPDDYASFNKNKSASVSNIPKIILSPDRPLNYLVLFLQNKIADGSTSINFFLLLFSSTLIVFGVFWLLKLLYVDNFTAFIGTLIFILLPTKLETYHTSIYFNINLVTAIYLWSIIFFIKYANYTRRVIYLLLSLFFYTVGIFWYEVGFFAPLFMLVYSCTNDRKSVKGVALFAIPFIFYSIYRITGAFGYSDFSNVSHNFNALLLPVNQVTDVFHHFLGRYMIRKTLYGFYKILSIEKSWLIALILLDMIFLCFIIKISKKNKIAKAPKNNLTLGLALFLVFLFPLFLNQGGGVAGRHLILPSAGVVMLLLGLMHRLKQKWSAFFIVLSVVFLIICQGNAWNQVIACRINGAVYETLKENRPELLQSKAIIFDSKSFADRIPFSWTDRDFNVLNTYYGAQTFEDWGLKSMAGLVLKGHEADIYVATDTVSMTKEDMVRFKVSNYKGYRSVEKRKVILPREKTFIIDFEKVYGRDFNNGKRNH